MSGAPRCPAKLRALALLSFGLWLFFLAAHVIAYGWHLSGAALFTALTAVSGAAYLRPEWLAAVFHRWGG